MKKVLKKIGLLACTSALVLSLASCGESEKNGSSNASTSTSKSEAAKNDNSANNKSNDNNSEGSSDGGNGGSSDSAPVAGETYDTGMFTVTVPSGWLAVPDADTFDNYDGDYDPTVINIVKDGKEDADMIDHAYIRISLFDKGTFATGKAWYDDVQDMDPVTVSGFECNAYSCTSYGYPYIMLEGANDVKDVSFSLLLKNDFSSFEYGDADVQTILNSVVVK